MTGSTLLESYTATMKKHLTCVLAIFLAGCGAHEGNDHAEAHASKASEPPVVAKTTPQGEVTDEKIGLPAYPNAKEVEYSRVKLQTDVGTTFSVAYQTSDSPAQVADFYRAEAGKVGTLKESIATNDLLKSVAVDRTDGSQSVVKAMRDNKGATIVTLHRFFPAK